MSQSNSDSNETQSPQPDIVERAKGIFDGARSLDEMITQLEEKQAELESLQNDDWELTDDVVVNDYAPISAPSNTNND